MTAAQHRIRANIEAATAKRARLLKQLEVYRYEDEYREAAVEERNAVDAQLAALWDDLRSQRLADSCGLATMEAVDRYYRAKRMGFQRAAGIKRAA